MKRVVTAAIAIVVGLAAFGPVAAQDMGMCPHEETVQSLRSCVLHARELAHIDNPGITRSLLAKLDAAATALERDQTAVAINILESFASEVGAQNGKHILAPHAAHLEMHARMVIDALNA